MAGSHVSLERTYNQVLNPPTEEECLQFANDISYQSTRKLNEFVRRRYNETGIGEIIKDRISNYINLGGDINNIEHEDGNTPLIAAVLNEDIEMINMLLFHGADITAKNRDDYDVFDIIIGVETETGEMFSERIKYALILAFNTKHSSN